MVALRISAPKRGVFFEKIRINTCAFGKFMIYYTIVCFRHTKTLCLEVSRRLMKKIDAVVLRETAYIAVWVLILSALMESVFLIGGWWDITVLLGNLLGGGTAVLNFFLMALTVQNAVIKEEKEAKDLVRLSLTLRNFMLVAVAVVGFILDCFNIIALLIPLLFPSIAVKIRPFFLKNTDERGEKTNE